MSDRQYYVDFFNEADVDHDGKLTLDELITYLRTKGYKGSDGDLKKMFLKADTNGDGTVSQTEFLEAMGQQNPVVHGKAAMRSVFVAFDKNGDGKIDIDELKSVMNENGRNITEADLNRMMSLCDDDQSGDIDYEEFMRHFFNLDL